MPTLGEKLRVLRKSRGFSLKQAAERIGCSASYLSMVENSKLDPSVSRLKTIAEGLGSTIVDLFQEAGEDDVIMRKAKRPRAVFLRSGLRIEILVPQVNGRQMDARVATVVPGGGSEGDYKHEGEEFGLVLKGCLELTIDGVTHSLQEGDSFYFESTHAHRFHNPGEVDSVVVWVNYPPSW